MKIFVAFLKKNSSIHFEILLSQNDKYLYIFSKVVDFGGFVSGLLSVLLRIFPVPLIVMHHIMRIYAVFKHTQERNLF